MGAVKKIRVHKIKFHIKKIDVTNFLDGSKVLVQYNDIYKVGKAPDVEVNNKYLLKIKDHYRDVFLASVVKPKLKRHNNENEEGIFVDNLFTDWDLAHELYGQIMLYTYGKKKSNLGILPEKTS